MKRAALLLIAAGAALYGLKLAADAMAAQTAESVDAGDELGAGLQLGGAVFGALDAANPWSWMERQAEQAKTIQAMNNRNMQAFGDMVSFAEGTARAADPYRVCYGYRHTIQSLADHPAITGEWRGESLDSLGPRYVGKISTAAGKYQIIKGTWLLAKRALGLVDFGPDSQDAAFAYLVKQRGALQAVERGDIRQAIELCAPEWASLPGSTAGQGTRRLSEILAVYQSAGGAMA